MIRKPTPDGYETSPSSNILYKMLSPWAWIGFFIIFLIIAMALLLVRNVCFNITARQQKKLPQRLDLQPMWNTTILAGHLFFHCCSHTNFIFALALLTFSIAIFRFSISTVVVKPCWQQKSVCFSQDFCVCFSTASMVGLWLRQ